MLGSWEFWGEEAVVGRKEWGRRGRGGRRGMWKGWGLPQGFLEGEAPGEGSS